MNKLVAGLLLGFVLISMVGAAFSGSGGVQGTALTQAVTVSDNHLHVADTSGFESSGYLDIQDEKMTYTGITATTFTGLTRGIENTTASPHPLVSNGLRVMVYSEDAGAVNKALGFNVGAVMASSGVLGVPIIAFQFFTKTIPQIIGWDCLSFLTGQLAIIRYVLIIVTVGFAIAFAIQLGIMLASALQKVIP